MFDNSKLELSVVGVMTPAINQAEARVLRKIVSWAFVGENDLRLTFFFLGMI